MVSAVNLGGRKGLMDQLPNYAMPLARAFKVNKDFSRRDGCNNNGKGLNKGWAAIISCGY